MQLLTKHWEKDYDVSSSPPYTFITHRATLEKQIALGEKVGPEGIKKTRTHMLPYNLESWLFFEFFFCMGNDKSRSKPSTKKYQNLPTASLFSTPNRMLSSKGTWCVYLMEKLSNLIEEQHGSGGALYICRQQESQKANKSSSFNNVCPIITLITKEPLKKVSYMERLAARPEHS